MENILNFKIFYLTSWQNPKIHYTFGGKGKWQNELLKRDARKKNLFFFEMNPNQAIEFAFCNETKTSWDNNYNKNYRVQINGEHCIVFKNTLVTFKQIATSSFVFSIDLDGTLLGDGIALKDFEICWLKHCLLDNSKYLVYNTGRNFKSAIGILSEYLAMLPDAVITGCGTEIYVYNEEKMDYVQEETWKLIQTEKFPAKDIEKSLRKYDTWLINTNFNDLRISYTVKYEDLQKNMEQLLEIKNESQKSLDVLISGSGDYRYIDILSSEGGKGKALMHLMSLIKMEKFQSYAFGDSMNDIEMLQMASFGIVVSNFQEDLGREISDRNLLNIEFSSFNNANAIFNKLKAILEI